MGECGRNPQPQTLDRDICMARDIAKRFEQLETQWSSFQKRSAKWEANQDTLQIVTGCLAQTRLEDASVQSTASSYSNPLFTNHPSRRFTHRSKKLNKSCSPQTKSTSIPTAENDEGSTKDAASSSAQASPILSSKLSRNTETPIKCSKFSSTSLTCLDAFPTILAKPSVPTFYDKDRKDHHKNLFLGEPVETHSPHTPVEEDILPSREFASKHVDMNQSAPGAFTNSKPAGLDPVTYPSGKGPARLKIPSGYDHLARAYQGRPCFPRSPPRESLSSTVDTEMSQLDLLSFGGDIPRNLTWRVIADRGILSEGVIKHSNGVEDGMIKDDRPSAKANPLKLEVDSNKKDIIENEDMKKGDQLLKQARWELRLSKREAALRVAEEKLLEDTRKISETQLLLNRNLNASVKANENESKTATFESLKSTDSATLMKKNLNSALKDVLQQLEQHEKAVQSAHLELKNSTDTGSKTQNPALVFAPNETPRKMLSICFDKVSLLAADDKCEEWTSMVIGVCERLVAYMDRETHLQKWAVALKKEEERILLWEEEVVQRRKALTEQSEAMLKSVGYKTSSVEEDRAKLVQEREKLVLWVTHLQERHKAVTECENDAAVLLEDAQIKKAQLEKREQEAAKLEEGLVATSQRLNDEEELVNREKVKVQEKQWQVAAIERDAEAKLLAVNQLQEEVDAQKLQVEKERWLEEKNQERVLSTNKEIELNLATKETKLRELEKELDSKNSDLEEARSDLDEREKVLKGMEEELEERKSRLREMVRDLDLEKSKLRKAEEATSECHIARKNADEAWVRAVEERREAAEYFQTVEERLKQWEDQLCVKQSELLQQQMVVEEVEMKARQDHDQSRVLQEKLVREQEKWGDEMKAKQEGMTKRAEVLDMKEAEIRTDLEKLTEERRRTIEEIKRFAEMESRTWAAERELQAKHEHHLQEVNRHAKENRDNLEELERAKSESDKELIEVHARNQALAMRQREADETLQSKLHSFNMGKEELTAQIQELRKLQEDIEQAGSQVIDRVAEMDQAAQKLELQREKVERSKFKLQLLTNKLASQHDTMRQRECDLRVLEVKVVTVQGGVKRAAAETLSKEKRLRIREQGLIDSANDLQELEGKLANEKRGLENMIAEVEQHAATLREEAAAIEECTQKRIQEELLSREREEYLQEKERELKDFEEALKKKAKILEEHGQTISKLEMQVKERFQRVAAKELKHTDLERGWERLSEEQRIFSQQKESLKLAKTELQRARTENTQRKEASEKHPMQEEIKKQQEEMVTSTRAREVAIETQEAKELEKGVQLIKLKHKGNERGERDKQESKEVVGNSLTKVDEQGTYVDKKRKATEAIAGIIEEREAAVKILEKELEHRESAVREREMKANTMGDSMTKSCAYMGLRSNGSTTNFLCKQEVLDFQYLSRENAVKSVHWLDDAEKRRFDSLLQNEVKEFRAQLREEESGTQSNLKQMKESLRQEAVKILQERADIHLQRQELEETRKAVQEVKLTLTTQLKATKQMVEDASLTAQAATREREALEEERKQLLNAQKEGENFFAEKQATLTLEVAQLENMKKLLEHEKSEALEIMQQAARTAVGSEGAKDSPNNMMHADNPLDSVSKKRERPETDLSQLEATQSKKLNAEETARTEMQVYDESDKALYVNVKGPPIRDTGVKSTRLRRTWEGDDFKSQGAAKNGASYRWTSGNLEDMTPLSDDVTHPAIERSSRTVNPDNTHQWNSSNIGYGYQFHYDSPTLSSTTFEKADAKNNEESSSPSKRELEMLMRNLRQTRQASRLQLQSMESGIFSFPPSFTVPVQQGLSALSARLSLMEQIEEGLESQLRTAFEFQRQDSEGVLVDKVQLLSRMQEQQSLRAEWEEDMQEQVETIGMLQAPTFHVTSEFGSPRTKLFAGSPNPNNCFGHNKFQAARWDAWWKCNV